MAKYFVNTWIVEKSLNKESTGEKKGWMKLGYIELDKVRF